MTFEIPRGRIVPVSQAMLRFDTAPHPFEQANGEAIEANWRREQAANPTLFDGQLLLFSALSLNGETLAGRCHAVRYATFLHWRRQRPDPGAEHVYANAVLVSSDGALIAARMTGSTANAGMAYFASGSFEPLDLAGGAIDVAANMRREVMEETGLDLAEALAEDGFHFLSLPSGNVLARTYRLPDTADAIAVRIERHVAGQQESEIAGPVVIRSLKDLPDRLASHMPALIAWHFTR